MLPRPFRITKDKEFDLIFSKGDSFFTPLFVFRRLTTNSPLPRFAFVVSNKVAKRATKRNLIKRRMRAAIQKNLKSILGGADIIVIATQKTIANGVPVAYGDIEQTMLYGLDKMQCLRKR